jgi:DNA-binding transcriptional ArsR family regulator
MQTRRDVFQAIADPIRRDIIGLVARKSMNLNSIAENFSVSRPAISQHIKLLTECGLIIIRQQGRERFCEASLAPLGQVADWIEPFRQSWEHQFSALDNLLDKLQGKRKDLRPDEDKIQKNKHNKKKRT